MKKTAVEWLIEQLGVDGMDATIAQALDMERKQMERIVDSYATYLLLRGDYRGDGHPMLSPKEFTKKHFEP